MIKTRELPQTGTVRTRKVFALLPTHFTHGIPEKPLRTTVWLDYYLIDECYHANGTWYYWAKRLITKENTNEL